MQPKFRVHAVDTKYGRKWRVVFPDGFAVRFLTWPKAMDYTLQQIRYAQRGHAKWMQRPPRSEGTLK